MSSFIERARARIRNLVNSFHITVNEENMSTLAQIENEIWSRLHGDLNMELDEIKITATSEPTTRDINRAFNRYQTIMGRELEVPNNQTKTAFLIQLLCSESPDYLIQNYSDEDLSEIITENCGKMKSVNPTKKNLKDTPSVPRGIKGVMGTRYNLDGSVQSFDPFDKRGPIGGFRKKHKSRKFNKFKKQTKKNRKRKSKKHRK
jgi:hypothetical protein